MNTYWKSRFEYWTTVQAITPERQRRGHLLSLFLLIFIVIGVVLVLQNAWGWLVHGNIIGGRFALISLLGVGIFAGLWQLNRRGHTTLIAHFLLNLVIIATSALSELAFLSTVFIAYAIPIIMAGFVLRPQWSFPYAVLTALAYILRFQFADVSIPALSDKQIAILFGLAAVNYLIASRFQDALKRAEENEERYRKLISSARDVIFTISTDGKITSLNPSFEIFTGWSRDEWLGRSFDALIAEDERPRARDYFNRALQSGTLRALRLRVPTRAGETLVVELNVSPQFKEGHVVGLLGIARDMTEEQRAGDALKASELRFRALIENSSDAVSLISADGSILYESPSVSRVLGYAPEELTGRNVFELLHPDDLPQIMPIFSQILQQPHKVMTATVRYRHKDGSWLWIEGFGHNLLAEPAVQAIVVNYRDITERKQVEEEIHRRADEMTALYETTHDLVIERDLSKLLHTIVARAAGLLKVSSGGLYLCEPEQRQVRCVVSYNTPRDYTGTVLKYGEGAAGIVAEMGEPLIIDDYRVWKGRSAVYEEDQPFVSVLSVPMRWQARVIGVIHILENTERRAFTEQDLRIATLFANQAAVAVENSRLLSDLQDAFKIQSRLFDAASSIASQLDIETILKKITENICDAIGADQSNVMLIDERGYCYRWIGSGYPYDLQPHFIRPDGITLRVIQSREATFISTAQNSTGLNPHMMDEGIQSTACLPLFGKSGAIGVMWVNFMTFHEFSLQEQAVLKAFTDHVSIAVENAALLATEQRRRQEAAAIAEVGRDISATLQLDVVLERIASYAKDLLGAETAAVYLAEPGMSTLRAVAAIGPDAEEIKNDTLQIGEGILGNIAMQKSGEIVYDTALDPRAITIEGTEITSLEHLMGVPVLSQDRLISLIAVWRTGAGREFKSTELDFLNSLAGQVAVAIENARLFEETQQRLREMQGLAQVGEAVSQNFELEPLLTQILDVACETILAAEKGSILLLEDHNALGIYALSGYADPRTHTVRFSTDAGYASLAVREKRGVLVPDALADASITLSVDIPEMNEIQSAMVAPLIVNQRVIGAISLDNASRKSAFTENDLRLLVALAGPASLAIENARLFTETRQRLTDLEILQTISTALRVAKTLDEALPIILDQLINLLDVGGALLDIRDPSSGEIVTELAHGVWAPVTGMRTPSDVGVSGRVIATGQPYVTTDLTADGLVVRPNLVGGLNAAACVPVIAQHQPIGVLWVGRQSQTSISKEEVTLLTALGEMVGNTIHRMSLREQTERLLEELQASNRELTQAYDTTLEGWAKALELRDRETEGHARRVTELTLRLARYMGVSKEELVNIHRGVLLHDIGKMGVPDHILKKTAPLTESEWMEMRQHPQYSYNMLAPIAYLRAAIDIPYCHHEHWDGSGYPRGLKGEEIPRSARIFSIVDIWDALLSDRPYRKAWPRNKIIDYIKENAGKILDPAVVEIFLKMISEDHKLESKLSTE